MCFISVVYNHKDKYFAHPSNFYNKCFQILTIKDDGKLLVLNWKCMKEINDQY